MSELVILIRLLQLCMLQQIAWILLDDDHTDDDDDDDDDDE